MTVKWIKLTTRMFDDEKIRVIESMPENDTILVIWVKLLVQAGRCNAGGLICISETIPMTDEMMAAVFSRPLNTVRLALKIFEQLAMIEKTEAGYLLCNWCKHQNTIGLDEIREQNRLRVQRHRQNRALPAPDITPDKTDQLPPINIKEEEIQNKIKNKSKNVTRNATVTLQDLPEPLQTEEFLNNWQQWQQYRAEIKKKLTPSTISQQLRKLATMGSDLAVQAICNSIENGWTGLFEPKGNQTNKQSGFDAMEWLKNLPTEATGGDTRNN